MRKATAIAAALALAGCGGGDGDGKRLTAAEYRRQADAICGKANADLRALEPPDSLEAMDDFVDEAKPIAQRAVDDLDDLEPPRDLEVAHDRWVGENRRVVELLDELTATRLPGIPSAAREFDGATERANETARDDLGLDECAGDRP